MNNDFKYMADHMRGQVLDMVWNQLIAYTGRRPWISIYGDIWGEAELQVSSQMKITILLSVAMESIITPNRVDSV